MRVHFRGNLFTEQLRSNSSHIVHVFTDRYQATHVPSWDCCIARGMHTTITVDVIKCGKYRLTELTRRLMLKKYLADILTLHILFAAKEQRT
jgi:hypothetical protein